MPRARRPYSSERGRARNLVPDSKSLATHPAVIRGRQQVSSRAEMRTNDSVHLEKALRVSSGFEASHALLPLARGLMRVLCPVVQVTVLAVSNTRHDEPFGGGIAA